MPPASSCAEIDLLPVSLGETASPEVQTHLDGCPVCRRRLDALRGELHNLRRAADALDSTTQTDLTRRAESLRAAPAVIGKFLVLGTLGGGGQATVYHVLHPQLKKELVVKLARETTPADEAERDLLVREGRVLAELDHPGLARVHDLGFHDGRPFLVMEYVRGVTLEQYAQGRRLTPRQAAGLIAAVARALGSAHRVGVVHQDVKPSNVVIDEAGRPRLIDFGLARLRGAWTGGAAQPGGGTAAFMAPEQARGEEQRVGPQSDVFALGGVLYFLMTGQQPFPGPGWHEAMKRAAQCDLDREALRRAKVPRGLEAICLRALAAEPGDRYPDADALAADLERFVARPRVLLGWAATAAGVLALLGGWWLFNQPGPVTRPAAEDNRDAALKEAPFRLSHVQRGKAPNPTVLTLESALPLKTGDHVHLECALPPGVQVALFWFDTEGNLANLTGASEVSRNRLHYPAGTKNVVPVIGPPGTEFILVCGGKSGRPSPELVHGLLGTGPLPALPDGVKAVSVSDSEVRAHVRRGVGAPARGAGSALVERLDGLRRGLAGRYEFVAGLALPHE